MPGCSDHTGNADADPAPRTLGPGLEVHLKAPRIPRSPLGLPEHKPEHLASALSVDRDGYDRRHRDDAPGAPHLEVGGVELEIGPAALDRALEEDARGA